MVDPARLFLWSGLIWHGALRAYWVSLVVRITVDLELSSLQLVLLGTAMELSILVAEVPTGVVADAFSRKWSVVTSFVLMGAAQLAAGIVEPFALLVATQVVWGIGFTFRSGAETAWITDELGGPDRVEQLILRRGRWQMVVSVVSILAGAGLAWSTSLTVSVVVSGLILLTTGLVLAAVMPERQRPTAQPRAVTSGWRAGWRNAIDTLTTGGRATWGHRSLRTLVVVLVLTGLGSEAVDRLDIRRLDDLGLSDRYDEVVLVGIIAAVEAGVAAAVLFWSRSRLAGRTVAPALGVVMAVSSLGVVALGLVASLPVAAVGLIIQGGVRTAALPLYDVWANAHAPSRVRATVLSFVGQAGSLGEIGGGVLVGAVAAATTVPTAMAVSAALLAAAAVVAVDGLRTWGPAGDGSAAAGPYADSAPSDAGTGPTEENR